MPSEMLASIDGTALDQLTVFGAIVSMTVRPVKRRLSNAKLPAFQHVKCWNARECALDLLNGSTIVPFAALLLSVFAPSMLKALTASSPLVVALAGGVGLVFTLGAVLSAK